MKRLALLLLALAALAPCGFLLIRPNARASPGATVTAAPGAQSEPDIVSHWRCDEGSGTTASDSVDANDGTLDGATWTTGKVGNALSFDGNDRVVIPDSSSLNPSNITVETWVNFDRIAYGPGVTGTDAQFLICKGGDRTEGAYYLFQGGLDSSSSHLAFTIKSGGGRLQLLTPEMTLETNRWYHVAGTYDGNTMKIYLDGVLQVSGDMGPTQVGNSSPLYFGYNDVGGFPYYLDGSLDEVAIFSRALTAPEIQRHYQDGLNSPGATITVNSTGDTSSRDGVLTLREAMLLANGGLAVGDLDSGECAQVSDSTYGPPCSTTDTIGAGSADTIEFNIPGTGPHTIQPASALPDITDPVTIDGYTQPGASPNTNPPGSGRNAVLKIELDGTNAGAGADGLRITAGNSTVKGLVINRFGGAGIELSGSGATGNVVQGNYIGTDVAGTADVGNSLAGLYIDGAPGNTIGGTAAGAGNVISGNTTGVWILGSGATGNLVQGNYIGTDVTGTAALGGPGHGVDIRGAPSNTIGGTTAAARNVIESIRKAFLKAGLVNADLSEYNILTTGAALWLIDWPQAVGVNHPNCRELLEHDVTAVAKFFRKAYGVELDEKKALLFATGEEESLE
ncbi:MAG: LamG-like jellyroll fold domain-containing protein [Dehalococcoidia bacterium]